MFGLETNVRVAWLGLNLHNEFHCVAGVAWSCIFYCRIFQKCFSLSYSYILLTWRPLWSCRLSWEERELKMDEWMVRDQVSKLRIWRTDGKRDSWRKSACRKGEMPNISVIVCSRVHQVTYSSHREPNFKPFSGCISWPNQRLPHILTVTSSCHCLCNYRIVYIYCFVSDWHLFWQGRGIFFLSPWYAIGPIVKLHL